MSTRPQTVLNRYLSAGQLLAKRYQLEGLIGNGSSGAVYNAIDVITHEIVAVKALPPPEEQDSQTAIARFKREMEIIRALVHPNIVTLYDYGETEQGVPFMVMEYIEGMTLERCTRHKPMGVEDGLHVLSQIASALHAAHALGIVHRDLKPANIMVKGGEGHYTVKMRDFGMAKLLSQIGESPVQQLTREGMAVGTPRYIAPEQARGLDVGPYTDTYALGLLAYEIFTGEYAVQFDDVEHAVMAHVSQQPLPLPLIGHVPAELRPIIRKLVAKSIPERYQSAAELTRDLDRLLAARRAAQRGPLFGQASAAPSSRPGHPAGPLVKPRQEEPLDIDYERLELASQQEKLAIQERATHKERMPHPSEVMHGDRRGVGHSLKIIEWALLPLLCFASFSLASLHLPALDYPLRLALSLLPYILAALFGWVVQDKHPALHIARLVNLTSLLLFAGAHLLDLGELKTQLMLDPVWYLKPLKESDVITPVADLIKSMAGLYVELLSLF